MNTGSASKTDRLDQYTESAIRHLPSHLRFFCVAIGLLWLDLWSKNLAFERLRADECRPILAHIFELRRSLNDGAVFGSFTGYVELFIVASLFALAFVFYLFARSRRSQRWLHIALACILAGAVGNLYDRALMTADVVTYRTRAGGEATRIGKIVSEPGDPNVQVGDWPEGKMPQRFEQDEVLRIHKQGVVRDFIKFVPKFPSWVPRLGGRDIWPWVFNIADAALVCGVALMLLTCWFERKPRKRA